MPTHSEHTNEPRPRAKGTQALARVPRADDRLDRARSDAREVASLIFDQALKDAGISTKECAYLFGKTESVVRRMRSADSPERVSYAQMLLLPPRFHLARLRLEVHRFGLRRDALRRQAEALADLSICEELR